MAESKNLYVPFRALGLVCDGLEGSNCSPYIYRRGLRTTITTPVDSARALHVYNLSLQLVGVSKPVPPAWFDNASNARISAVAVLDDVTYAAFDSVIVLYHFLRPYAVWRTHSDPVSHMLVLGQFLVTISADEHRVLAFRLPDNYKDRPGEAPDVVADVTLPVDFKVMAVCHPQTYVNKILLGAEDGRCMLVNLRSKTIVHTFSSFGAPVTVLSPSPVLDVVAVGTADGRTVLHNFKFDETVVTYQNDADEELTTSGVKHSAIRAVSFRMDGSETMVTADKGGNLLNWDLNEKRLLSAALSIHRGGVCLAEFLEGEPVLLTAGTTDNAIKSHIFDSSEGEARLLRCREGHSLPPTSVRFCGRSTTMMVSAGLDRELRLVSTIQDSKNKTFSQAGLSRMSAKTKKRLRKRKGVEVGARDASITGLLPVVTAMAANTSKIRDGDFANVVTAHANRKEVYTWQSKSTRAFKHVLTPGPRPGQLRLALTAMREPASRKKERLEKPAPKSENKTATCVAISPCGNFAIAGSSDGRVHIYNLQSGTHIGAFEEVNDGTEKKLNTPEWGYAHAGAVAEVAVDALSDVLLTCGRRDRAIKYWKLRTRRRDQKTIETPAEAVALRWCAGSDLLAVACDDFGIYVYDAASTKLAREFRGHRGPVKDMCFDWEGRRLVSASMDGTLRTWDLPSGRCIDTMRCKDTPTSVVVAPRSAFVATTHVGSLAVVLWVDRSKFMSVDAVKKKKSAADVGLPSIDNVVLSDASSSEDSDSTSHSDMEGSDSDEGDAKTGAFAAELATFSDKPTTHWTVLSDLNAIRERNKPIAPPKKPESVPFFIPTVKGVEMKFDLEGDTEMTDKANGSTNKDPESDEDGDLGNSTFGKLVASAQFDTATSLLYSLKPSGIDLEIRTIAGKAGLRGAAEYFLGQLRRVENFELTQAHLGVFLNAHGVEFAGLEGSNEVLRNLLEAQEEAWAGLRGRMDAVVALSAHFSGQV